MADIVRGRKADGEIVRYRILAELLLFDESHGKIECQLVAGRTECQSRREVLVISRAIGMRKGTAETRKIGLVFPVISLAEKILR